MPIILTIKRFFMSRRNPIWEDPRHHAERTAAHRMGFYTHTIVSRWKADKFYLVIGIINEDLIGALELYDNNRRCVIHRSTKGPGWQLSFFYKKRTLPCKHTMTLQYALDGARLQGYVLRRTMLRSGRILE